jgi:hypothetical protein
MLTPRGAHHLAGQRGRCWVESMARMESKGEENDDDGSSRFYLTLNSFEIVLTYPLQKIKKTQ